MEDNEVWSTLRTTLPLYIHSESAVSRTNFSTLFLPLFNEIQILEFPCFSTSEDLSIDVSIINVGLILTKLRWFQLVNTSQNQFRNFKKIQIFGFSWCSTREDLSIDVSITNLGLILMKLCWFLFSGYGQMDRRTDRRTDGQTDRHGFGILKWKHVGTQKNFNSKLKISG